jgi:HAD domain in Swiss Army Knife RNA repair proteins
MYKYIFLDIDGVIATNKTVIHGTWGLTPECQDFLGFILEKTDAKIILTSSWRLNTLEDTINYMKEQNFRYCDKLIGITIRAYKYLDKTKKVHLSIPRGVEIKQYIDTHLIYPWYAYPERSKEFEILNEDGSFKQMRSQKLSIDYNYIILDDDTDMLLEQKDHFVNTDSMNGLSIEDAEKAIQILNKIN